MRIRKFYFVLILVILLASCVSSKRSMLKPHNKLVLKRYAELVDRSNQFLTGINQISFVDSVSTFVKRDSLHLSSERAEPAIGSPIFVSNDQEKAIVPIILRCTDLAGNRVDMVNYISGRYIQGNWKFTLFTHQTNSYGYCQDDPSLTDEQIGLEYVRYFVLTEYFDKSAEDERIFSSAIYVLK